MSLAGGRVSFGGRLGSLCLHAIQLHMQVANQRSPGLLARSSTLGRGRLVRDRVQLCDLALDCLEAVLAEATPEARLFPLARLLVQEAPVGLAIALHLLLHFSEGFPCLPDLRVYLVDQRLLGPKSLGGSFRISLSRRAVLLATARRPVSATQPRNGLANATSGEFGGQAGAPRPSGQKSSDLELEFDPFPAALLVQALLLLLDFSPVLHRRPAAFGDWRRRHRLLCPPPSRS